MKVLIVNKFYYNRGGAEVVAINLRDELKSRGYDVAVFTMDYPENFQGDYIYTAPEVSFKNGAAGKLKFAERTFGGAGVAAAFKKALREFKPDVVHLHNIHSYLSPVVARLAKKVGCRVVWTLHDYKLACPAYSCLNHGKVCERCFSDKSAILSQRCFKNSFAASALAYLEAKKWNVAKLEKWVDVFVCPSRFMYNQMIKGGISKDKLSVVCNFVDPIKIEELAHNDCTKKEDYYAYIGRLSEEKGVETLLKAASKLPYKLKVAGTGPLHEYFTKNYNSANIEYMGQLDAVGVSNLLEHTKLLISPSECYENNPLSVIEALCAGTPVIGARIGGIPELVKPSNGLTFESGNCDELAECISKIMGGEDYNYSLIADNARRDFSADTHLSKLIPLYRGC